MREWAWCGVALESCIINSVFYDSHVISREYFLDIKLRPDYIL